MPIAPLTFESPFHELGPHFSDEVQPAQCVGLRLRWRSDDLLTRLGAEPPPSDDSLIAHFGAFEAMPGVPHPPIAQRYIGYQFRSFNPHLGDGRGFLLAQIRGPGGTLWDLGTKGSGTTPYSRGGDGRLTLKGGVREIIAAEFLHAMGVKTSRPLTLIEHTQDLYRGDEPSPTRASILVRMGESHVRFGTFERPFYLVRDADEKAAMLGQLVDHVVEVYYPHLAAYQGPERAAALFDAVVGRTAEMVAGWMSAGFAHGVLNTDNMNITGDSFDYGPFAFMEEYDPGFTAAYFDQSGLYAFESQADACAWNLAQLARPFAVLAPEAELRRAFESYLGRFHHALRRRILPRMGFEDDGSDEALSLMGATFNLLREQGPSYHGFFRALSDRLSCKGVEEGGPSLPDHLWAKAAEAQSGDVISWRRAWSQMAQRAQKKGDGSPELAARCRQSNPLHVPHRREIERVWAAIDKWDDWQPFYEWMVKLKAPFSP